MTIGELLGISRDITVTALLMIAVWGSFRGWWVPGWIYRQSQTEVEVMRHERDEFKRELWEIHGLARRSVGVAEQAVARSTYGDRLEAEREIRSPRGKAPTRDV